MKQEGRAQRKKGVKHAKSNFGREISRKAFTAETPGVSLISGGKHTLQRTGGELIRKAHSRIITVVFMNGEDAFVLSWGVCFLGRGGVGGGEKIQSQKGGERGQREAESRESCFEEEKACFTGKWVWGRRLSWQGVLWRMGIFGRVVCLSILGGHRKKGVSMRGGLNRSRGKKDGGR